ncbi:pyruvate carboxylase [Anatilimnocola floriformis]|uniref:pyruvate carboxylase n=1 Tax=Anatilimnocola floriformis TaxID=2948575 RepID=UPI0020C4ABD5|nr:pyruvate carboxylase [Anatilimnocola floriformis]
MNKITKLLVANRSEIAIRVFRSAHELGIRTVAIYAHEDRYALHRFKADEAYLIGKPGEPIRSYLNIPEIIAVAKQHGVDGIHPGYGFLSENPELAKACKAAGITFVGPHEEALKKLGDKTFARSIAEQTQVPILSGSDAIPNAQDGLKKATKLGFPIILKAAHGGGGRGMRVVLKEADFVTSFESAQRESMSAFGSPDVFIEKYITSASHIEVQLLGDKHGNLFHLWERDCSVQRRHQKVVEIAPAPHLDPAVRQALCDAAVKIGRAVKYENAGTVEFLVDRETNQFYFIEVNPRIQVEHTVTEEVTGIDIVKSQILIAQGVPLADPEIGLPSQDLVKTNGFAIQCRVTTEDPANNFMPDYGRIAHYRSASGMGIRLDAGSAYSGATVNPFYDSLLVKVSARGRRFVDAARRMERCLQEFRIRGVKTNIPFLIQLITHPTFLAGDCTTRFIDQTPDLFHMAKRRNRATKLLTYLGEVIVNGNPLVKGMPKATRRLPAPVPRIEKGTTPPPGSRDKWKELGPAKFGEWVNKQKGLLLTDTTFRDAHQSLLATRMRTKDLTNIAEVYSHHLSELFSLEMWGGATFDTSMRFLKECPWQRLADMRAKVPNILFQMLFRASNAVGYASYPDNVVRDFCKEAAEAGMDIFRIFDSLNWVPNMKVAMEAVLKAGGLCEPAICYTGDILNPSRTKYNLQYYVDLAKELESLGAHILCIKDMAGLCKPYAAELLVKTLKQEIGIPIHFHTHDTAGMQAASIFKAAEAKLNISDAAMAPMSGGTSQPNLNAIVEGLRFTKRDTGLDAEKLNRVADYWQAVREFYLPFDSVMLPATAELYEHEMPGGQYTNLYQQARAIGLADRWTQVCKMYAETNQLLGDIVKVTPSSKAVGDLALFLVANDLQPKDIVEGTRDFAFPESVIDLLSGMMGQPPGGFPKAVQKRILRDRKAVKGRPGASLPPADMEAATTKVKGLLLRDPSRREVLSHILYPKVFEEFAEHQRKYSDTSIFPTPVFFFGQEPGEEMAIDIEEGKTLIVKFLNVGESNADGKRTVFFELNGQPREVTIDDKSAEASATKRMKADSSNKQQVGASMPGMVVSVAVKAGDSVAKGQKLLSLEAMKMETTVVAEQDGKIAELFVKPGTRVETGDLMLTYA